jgi:transposase
MNTGKLLGMKPYSQDLRERVIATIRTGQHTQAEIAELYGLAQATVENWWRRWRATGSVAALPHAGGNPRALRECEAMIRAEVNKRPDLSLEELCTRVKARTDVVASPSMMCRELQHLKLPRKKSRSTTANGRPHG